MCYYGIDEKCARVLPGGRALFVWMEESMTREELMRKIAEAKSDLKTAGPIHRRDLRKHIHRMEIALKRLPRDNAQIS